MNLLNETLEDIKESGHETTDVVFIGSRDSGHQCTWGEFTKLANQDYDDGFGVQKVANDLEIVFSDGSTMWRHACDGAEGWHFSHPFERPGESRQITRLFVPENCIGWMSLEEIHDGA